jgi:hypothetical protein
MPAFFETLADLIQEVIDPAASGNLPPAPEVIQNLGDWLSELTDFSRRVDQDLSKLPSLLNHLKPPGAPDLGDSMLVRMLQHAFPRVAEGLTLLGLIEYHFDAGKLVRHTIRWDQVSELTSRPAGLLKDSLAGKIDAADAKGIVNAHLLSVQLAAILLAPRPMLLMEHDGQGIASLPTELKDGSMNPVENSWKPLNDAPWLFKLELPTPGHLKLLKPVAADVATFLSYLEKRRIPPGSSNPLNPLDVPALPTLNNLPAPDPGSPPGSPVLPTFRRGSVQFGVAARWDGPSNTTFPLGRGWQATVQRAATTRMELIYNGTAWDLQIEPQDQLAEFFTASIQNSETLRLFETAGLIAEMKEVSAFARLNNPDVNGPRFTLGLRVAGLSAGLKSDEYLSVFGLTQALQASIDIDTAYDEGRGLRVQAAGKETPALGIDFVQPINRSFGAGGVSLTLRQARLRLETRAEDGGLALQFKLRLSLEAQLGPVNATITDFGAWAGRSGGQSFGVLGPQGVGVRIDAGLVQGGGFMAESPPDSGRFLGALALKVLAIGVGAFGIYERTPENRLSFAVVIGARFPGIQLGFGFMLTGIGGMVGINRRADVDQLASRLASGASGNVLFCDDPVHNAPALFNDLAAFFPPADGVFILGPTVQLGWLFIVRMDLGVLIELPGPSHILIVGSARATIPGLGSAVPLVNLRIDIIGDIDLAASLIRFDASLVDSTVLGVFSLTGDSAFRFSYGASAYVLLSIGGFHPSYNPEPIKIRKLARASAGYSTDAGIKIWMRSLFYFAFTPNTLQLGGAVEAGLEIGPVAAHGHYSFDALVQFKPFYFQFDISAGFDIEFHGHSICSVDLDGHVSGPGPLVISARVSLKILFWRPSFHKTFTLGSGNGDVQTIDVDVLEKLLAEVPKIENVHVEDNERTVVLKKSTPGDIALVSASSKIVWAQRLAPFDVRLERFGGTPLTRQFQVGLATPGKKIDTVKDVFGLGSYANVDASQSLNNDAFHREKAGLILGHEIVIDSLAVDCTIAVKVYKVPAPKPLFELVAAWHLSPGLQEATGGHSSPARAKTGPELVRVKDESWRARGAAGGVLADGVSAFQAFQTARSGQGFAVPVVEESIDLAGVTS